MLDRTGKDGAARFIAGFRRVSGRGCDAMVEIDIVTNADTSRPRQNGHNGAGAMLATLGDMNTSRFRQGDR